MYGYLKREKKSVSWTKILFLKEIFLSSGHDRIVAIKSRNFPIAKVWCCMGLY